jgi:hypothetical protein
MDAAPLSCRFHRRPCRINVLRHTSRQTRNPRPPHLPSNGLYSLEIPITNHRETCLDYIHFQPGQLPGNLEFLAEVHRRSWALLTVAERCVKDDDLRLLHDLARLSGPPTCRPVVYSFLFAEYKDPTAYSGSGVHEIRRSRLNPRRRAAR